MPAHALGLLRECEQCFARQHLAFTGQPPGEQAGGQRGLDLMAKGVEPSAAIAQLLATDAARGYISWISPVARALIKARVGDVVKLAVPGGLQELEVLDVRYPAPA